MVITFEQIVGQNNWKEIHRTEVVKNKHNTQFLSKLVVTHRFEEKQPMRFDVFDSDSKKHGLDNHDFLGTVEFSLGKLVSNKLVRLFTLNFKWQLKKFTIPQKIHFHLSILGTIII